MPSRVINSEIFSVMALVFSTIFLVDAFTQGEYKLHLLLLILNKPGFLDVLLPLSIGVGFASLSFIFYNSLSEKNDQFILEDDNLTQVGSARTSAAQNPRSDPAELRRPTMGKSETTVAGPSHLDRKILNEDMFGKIRIVTKESLPPIQEQDEQFILKLIAEAEQMYPNPNEGKFVW